MFCILGIIKTSIMAKKVNLIGRTGNPKPKLTGLGKKRAAEAEKIRKEKAKARKERYGKAKNASKATSGSSSAASRVRKSKKK
jgi:hypothetical protein